MFLLEDYKKEDDKLIDIENGGIYECLIESELAIHSIFESMYQMDKNEICGIVTESIGDKFKSLGSKIMKGLESIKNFLKNLIKSFINLFKKANQDDKEFIKKAEAKMSGRATTNSSSKDKDINPNNDEKNLTTVKGQSTNDHYSNKIANIKGYTFNGLGSYLQTLDLVNIYRLSYDLIERTPIIFVEMNKDPVSAIKEARKKLRPYIAKKYGKNGDGTNFEKEMTNYIYGSEGLTHVSIKFEDAINSLKTECPYMLKKLNEQLGKIDSIFDGFIKGYRQSDIRRMRSYEKFAEKETDEEERNELKKDNDYIRDMTQKISLDYLNCINDIKAMYVASLNICIKAVNAKRKQNRFAINTILGGV